MGMGLSANARNITLIYEWFVRLFWFLHWDCNAISREDLGVGKSRCYGLRAPMPTSETASMDHTADRALARARDAILPLLASSQGQDGETRAAVIARAVLVAIREPDQTMVSAGADDGEWAGGNTPESYRLGRARVWRSMIDAALAD